MIYLLLILPPMLWAATNLVDRILVDGDGVDSRPASLMAIYGLFNGLVAVALGGWLLATGMDIAGPQTLALALNGATHMAAIWMYFHALRGEETSRVVPWFQTVPAFGILGGAIVLAELPIWWQLAAIGLLMIGGFCLSIKNGVAKRKMMALMLGASVLLATNDVIFALFGRGAEGISAIFPDVAGKAFWGMLFLVRKDTRQGFMPGLKNKFALQALGGILAIAADSICDLGKLLLPVSIVQATACSTPLFVLGGAVLFTKFRPNILTEELGGAAWKRFAGIALIIAGGIILALST